jgi:hypothetical protein
LLSVALKQPGELRARHAKIIPLTPAFEPQGHEMIGASALLDLHFDGQVGTRDLRQSEQDTNYDYPE